MMDEDRLTPGLGRLIDAAKSAAGAQRTGGQLVGRSEGWAVLGRDGEAYTGPDLAAAVAAATEARTQPEAAAFAVVGEPGETLLPVGSWRTGAEDADPDLPVVVKYLGRWVLVTLGELPEGSFGTETGT